MKKEHKVVWLIVSLVVLLGLLARYCVPPKGDVVITPLDKNTNSGDVPGLLPSHAVASQASTMSAFLSAFKTQIELYGKVVDQHGDPVSGATVRLFPVDTPSGDQSKSKLTITSDIDGKFSIKGLRGFSLGVQVNKEGYLYLSPLGGPASSASISYANGAEEGKRFSNPATPLVLQLQKTGPLEPMFYVEQKRWYMPTNGTVREVALDSKDGTGLHKIEFRFKSDWGNLPKNNEMYGKIYDWSFEARIPGGGFLWNDSDYNFEAPESGYKESIQYDHPANQPREKWKEFQHGRYFVKFADGSHGRIRFSVDGSTEADYGPLSMTSWLNLKPGSRNLASLLKDSSGFHGGDPDKE